MYALRRYSVHYTAPSILPAIGIMLAPIGLEVTSIMALDILSIPAIRSLLQTVEHASRVEAADVVSRADAATNAV